MISIHALREEGDLDSDIAQIIYKISIHALREEGDQRQPCIVAKLLYFYPRPPRGGRLLTQQEITQINDFYPRPPRGGRPGAGGACKGSGYFYPRPPRGGRRNGSWPNKASISYFYPRPPRGGRPASVLPWVHASRFLSTPSARRATECAFSGHRSGTISIHALREEGDGRHPVLCCFGYYFYPRPPRGGRLLVRVCTMLLVIFLSTPSARRATGSGIAGSTDRRISIHALREEGDLPYSSWERGSNEFLSTPSARRATIPRPHLLCWHHDFYPRPPRGGRRRERGGLRDD